MAFFLAGCGVVLWSDSARGRFNVPRTEILLTGEVLVPLDGRAASLEKGFSAGLEIGVEDFVILIFALGADSVF